jgi:hypothetical protein
MTIGTHIPSYIMVGTSYGEHIPCVKDFFARLWKTGLTFALWSFIYAENSISPRERHDYNNSNATPGNARRVPHWMVEKGNAYMPNWKHAMGIAIGLYLYTAFVRSIVSSFATQVGFPLSAS